MSQKAGNESLLMKVFRGTFKKGVDPKGVDTLTPSAGWVDHRMREKEARNKSGKNNHQLKSCGLFSSVSKSLKCRCYTYMRNLKYDTNEPIYETETESQT